MSKPFYENTITNGKKIIKNQVQKQKHPAYESKGAE